MNELIVKKKELLELKKQELIDLYQKEINKINEMIDIVEACDIKKEDNLDTVVFKLYFIFNSVSEVSNYLNDLGYRIKTTSKQGERKYNSNDVTAIIKNKDALVDERLKVIVQRIQKANYKNIAKRWF